MEDWANFFVAQLTASAALAGLIFVAVSISLPKIVTSPHLPSRAFQALLVLLQILVVSSLMLVPHQPRQLIGLELLIIGAVCWAMVAIFDQRSLRSAAPEYRSRTIYRMCFSQAAAASYVIAGATMLIWGRDGLYWLVPAILLSFLVAMLDAWVLLVEINR